MYKMINDASYSESILLKGNTAFIDKLNKETDGPVLDYKKVIKEIKKKNKDNVPSNIIEKDTRYKIKTRSGNIFVGTVIKESTDAIELKTSIGRINIKKKDILDKKRI